MRSVDLESANPIKTVNAWWNVDGIISVGGLSGVRDKVGVPCVKNTMPKPSANSVSNSDTEVSPLPSQIKQSTCKLPGLSSLCSKHESCSQRSEYAERFQTLRL